MLPASFNVSYSLLRPKLEEVAHYLESRLRAEFTSLNPVTIQVRVKGPESVLSKLQKGDYSGFSEIDDLVAARAVFLHSSQVQGALAAVRSAFVGRIVEERNVAVGKPTDFRYQQPHVIAKLPADFVDRHPELEPIMFELQATTYVQHALQESTHDIIYKGERFSWREHRLDSRLRGLLEIVDDVLENLQSIAEVNPDPAYSDFDRRNSIVSAAKEAFGPENLPADLRRFAISVEGILSASQVSPDEMPELMSRHPDLLAAFSLTAVDKILGAVLRERADTLVQRAKRQRFLVTPELESLVTETRVLGTDKRVAF